MAIFKCKMCGGALDVAPDSTIAQCEYCGSQQTLPRITDERLTSFYERANDLRMSHEFDKAAEIYEKIIEENPTDADAYWSMVLCRYGIDYVEEGLTRKPTINRAQMISVTEDVNYRSAMKYADTAQQRIYEEEAAKIDRILQRYLEISRNEPAYDVFICYKETGFDGKRTVDSVRAGEIYRELTNEGFKVFFAPVTLENKLGEDYEPYIFAAIHSAKVMVVIGTKPEHMNAVWVKNEWSRFLTLAKEDSKKSLIPVYSNMDPYDMPEAFRFKQSQNMEKLGFMLDLVRGIEKLVGKETAVKASQPAAPVKSAASSANVDSLLQRAAIFLDDQEWDSANVYCEKVLDIAPTNGKAYLYKLLADAEVSREEELQFLDTPLEDLRSYKNAVRYADESVTSKLIKWNQAIKNRLTKQEQYRQKHQSLANAIDNAASQLSSLTREKEQTEYLLETSKNKAKDLKKYKSKLCTRSALALFTGIIILATYNGGSGAFAPFYIAQLVFAVMLAAARGRPKGKAFFAALFTIGVWPIVPAIGGLIEAARSSVQKLQAEQKNYQDRIAQLESQISVSRNALNELNQKMAEFKATL